MRSGGGAASLRELNTPASFPYVPISLSYFRKEWERSRYDVPREVTPMPQSCLHPFPLCTRKPPLASEDRTVRSSRIGNSFSRRSSRRIDLSTREVKRRDARNGIDWRRTCRELRDVIYVFFLFFFLLSGKLFSVNVE